MATEITSLKSKSQSISSDVTPDDDNPAADVAVEFVLVLFVTAAAMLELINNSYTLADNVKQGHVKNVQGNASEWNSTNLTNASEWNISNSANVSWVINHFNSIEHSMNMINKTDHELSINKTTPHLTNILNNLSDLRSYISNTAKNNISNGSTSNISNDSTSHHTLPMSGTESKLQSQLSTQSITRRALHSIFAAITAVLLASYGDSAGRKHGFLIPTVTSLIATLIVFVVVQLELDSVYLSLASSVQGIGGSTAAVMATSYAYTADKTSATHRSFRIYVIHQLCIIGQRISVIGTYLIPLAGYLTVFILIIIIFITCFCLIMKEMKDTIKKSVDASFFQLGHFARSVSLLCQDTPGKSRWKVQLNALVVSIVTIAESGTGMTVALAMAAMAAHSTHLTVSLYRVAVPMIASGGGIIGSTFIHKHVGDHGAIVIGSLSAVSYHVIQACAGEIIQLMFLGAIFGMFSLLPQAMASSHASKSIQPSDHGSMFGCLAALTELSSVLSMVLYHIALNIPGMSALDRISIAVAIPYLIAAALSWLHIYLNRREDSQRQHLQAMYSSTDDQVQLTTNMEQASGRSDNSDKSGNSESGDSQGSFGNG